MINFGYAKDVFTDAGTGRMMIRRKRGAFNDDNKEHPGG